MKSYSEFLLESNNNEVIVYHMSNDLEHMINSDFKLDYSNEDNSIFGKAFYFSTSYNITNQLGKYMCKFKIKLDEPILNMNDEMSNDEANKLLQIFLKKYNHVISFYDKESSSWVENFDFNDEFEGVQYGEFFLELQQNICENSPNNNFYDFITNYLGYNSFKYYQDYGTNFITKKGDYGICYGIYNPKNIKYIK